MPRISQYYGIAVYMYYEDHAPPHFHAIYGEFEAMIGIQSDDVLDGSLPRRALTLVKVGRSPSALESDTSSTLGDL